MIFPLIIFSLQAWAQSTEPHQPGPILFFKEPIIFAPSYTKLSLERPGKGEGMKEVNYVGD